MSKMKLQQILAYDVITKISIENNLAPLSIEASPHGKVELICELDLTEPYEEFNLEDCINTSCKDGNMEIVLDEVDGLDKHFFSPNRSFVKILVPVDATLEVGVENLPASFSGIHNTLLVSSENAPIRIQDCNGNKTLTNENGPISISNCEGDLSVELENGPMAAEMISGATLSIKTENGPLKIREACFPKVDIESENGVIMYETLFVEDAVINLKTENGVVHFVLPDEMDFELRARTEQGKIKSRLSHPVTQEEDDYVVKNGEGKTKINIFTENGMIKLGEKDKINLEFLKAKIELLKESLKNVNDGEDMEKVHKLYANVSEYVTARVANAKEAIVKDNIKEQLDKLHKLIEDFDYQGAKEKTIAGVDELTGKIHDELSKHMGKLGTKITETIHVHTGKHAFNMNNLNEYISKVVNSSLIKPYLGGEMKAKEKDEVADRSRLKILDMLEAGKITAEEAEKLLKAIGKE
ncbi:MAG: hypothetical protein CVU50_01460 [Candidatus Cloacimonetes bacterium HGW-Cloacimonetes-3]|jgi:hypothetical protein|nr:MAG: hypothetical protein CVU50_01460 [Candidatus Cloacimonetes bacterium HGW-Cloacimonetes-3]